MTIKALLEKVKINCPVRIIRNGEEICDSTNISLESSDILYQIVLEIDCETRYGHDDYYTGLIIHIL